MQRKTLILLSVMAALVVGCTGKQTADRPDSDLTSSPPSSETASALASSGDSSAGTVLAGVFMAGEHPTEGMARIVEENGDRYLEFDQAFKTDNGPDLFVILHRSDAPPITGISEEDYVSLAPLTSTTGTQRYLIPNDVSLDDFKSAVIWCRMFNATFGYAPFMS